MDGIDEWLEWLAVELTAARAPAIAAEQALAMRATDAGVDWQINGTASGINWGHGTSGSPPTGETRAGVPAASDSATISPKPSSATVGTTERSAAR